MTSLIFSAAVLLMTRTLAAPTTPSSFVTIPASFVSGFRNPSVQSSVGGKAICISGFVDVTASAKNVHLNYAEPVNQTEVTELTVETFQVNSTIGKQLVGDETTVSGTYGIYSQLCFPASPGTINTTTLQFLIHGSGFDRAYWNLAPGYSYVDAAAEQGYTTFLYDRLGTGLSDHPDAIQVVQLPIQVSIAHELIQLLRSGGIASQKFTNVVGVGHSFGSFQANVLTAQHPKDLDAAVLTGFSTDESGRQVAFSGLDLVIASQSFPLRFSGLSNGYLTGKSIEGSQSFFFRSPGFDPALLNLADASKQTLSIGELFSAVAVVAPDFTGPIDVVNGMYDLPNCHGNCLVPYNKVSTVKDMFYPAASDQSSWYLAEHAGHGLNFHYTAADAYEHILDFIKKNGF